MSNLDFLAEVATDAPVIAYRFTDGPAATTATDSSGNANHGTYFGADIAHESAGQNNLDSSRGVRFNPAAAYTAGLVLNPVPGAFPTTAITIEWIQRDITVGAGRTLFSYGVTGQLDMFRVIWASATQMTVIINGAAAVALNFANGIHGEVGPRNVHYALTWRNSDGRLQIWKNGALGATATAGTPTLTAGGALVLCQDQDSLAGTYVVGDALRVTLCAMNVYASVLSDARIRAHATAALTSYYTVREVPTAYTFGDLSSDMIEFRPSSDDLADLDAPTIGYSPGAGSILHSTHVVVSVTDVADEFTGATAALRAISVFAEHGSESELVAVVTIASGVPTTWWSSLYSAGSTLGTITNGWQFDLVRALGSLTGWPWASFTIRTVSVDVAGNASTSSVAYTVSPNYVTAPVFAFLPTSGASIDSADSVQVDITETAPDTIVSARFVASFTSAAPEVVFDGAPGSGGETGFGVVESAISGGRRWVITRTGGWLEGLVLAAEVETLGGAGTSSASYTVTNLPSPGDIVAPVTANPFPTPGTPITTETPIGVEVTDETGLFRRVLVCVVLAGITEVAWDGDAWTGNYSAAGGCSREPIAGGFRFRLLRTGGWPSSPTLKVYAFDQGGNEV